MTASTILYELTRIIPRRETAKIANNRMIKICRKEDIFKEQPLKKNKVKHQSDLHMKEDALNQVLIKLKKSICQYSGLGIENNCFTKN